MITVVSGLPRSGTSLMMNMLTQGGVEPFTDNTREPDESNPLGYFECEKVKELHRDNTWLHEIEDQAIKIVAQWLPFLSRENEYSVIFMERNIEEVLLSQEKMLVAAGRDYASADPELLALSYQKLVEVMQEWLLQQPNMRVLNLDYHDVISDPLFSAIKVKEFFGGELDIERMSSVVETTLYRQKIREVQLPSI